MIKPVKIKNGKCSRISQGDILRDVEMIEYAIEKDGKIEISKIEFPLVIVLSQDCDLQQDFAYRWGKPQKSTQDKYLISVLVAPLYNAEHVFEGNHLSELNLKMQDINSDTSKSVKEKIKDNEIPRYHYIIFPEDVPIVPSIIDFKHYFSVNVEHLKKVKQKSFICKVSELYRERISQRFANFLSRIGLP